MLTSKHDIEAPAVPTLSSYLHTAEGLTDRLHAVGRLLNSLNRALSGDVGPIGGESHPEPSTIMERMADHVNSLERATSILDAEVNLLISRVGVNVVAAGVVEDAVIPYKVSGGSISTKDFAGGRTMRAY